MFLKALVVFFVLQNFDATIDLEGGGEGRGGGPLD